MRIDITIRLARTSVALVWLYNGLWCKLLGRCPDHLAIIASVFEPMGFPNVIPVVTLGIVEVFIAGNVLTGRQPRFWAGLQTFLLLAMNGVGLIFGGEHIADVASMIVHSLVLIALVWLLAAITEPNPLPETE
ncbi:MAG: DoxX-like family protein [Acidobacteriota bacterium]